jgi:hypothetical protein
MTRKRVASTVPNWHGSDRSMAVIAMMEGE